MKCDDRGCQNHAMVKLMDSRPLCAAHYAAKFPTGGGGVWQILDREQWDSWLRRLAVEQHARKAIR